MIEAATPINSAVAITAPTTTETLFTETNLNAKTTWSNCVLHIQLTNGATASRPGESLTLYYAFSPFGAVPNSTAIRGAARCVSIPLQPTAGALTISSTGLIPVSGGSLYTWFAHEEWTAGRTVTLLVAGLP